MLARFLISTLVIATVLATSVTQAQPRTPTSDDEVLERVPDYQSARALLRLRNALAANPTNETLASQAAGQELVMSRLTGESRYLGYAQAALAPWWNEADAPAGIILLRASVKQRRHDFPEAMADLDKVVAAEPFNAKAWFARALVHQVQGDFPSALSDCGHLPGLVDVLASASCRYTVASFTGQAHESYKALSALLNNNLFAPAAEQEWAQTTLADIAVRLGDDNAAEEHFHRAVELDSRDPYLLAAYADFLLDRIRPQEVVGLLSETTFAASDPILLRLTLASLAIGVNAERGINDLKERFDIYHQRKDRGASREEARFALDCLHQTGPAVTLAQENWQRQREPSDARLLLEAAIAAHDRAAAAPVLQWMQQSGIEDVRLSRLAVTIGAQS